MINLYDILDAADGQLFGEPAAQIFTGFSFDPRQVQAGDLFVALKTERGDGHLYMEEAMKAGAAGLMCTHPPNFDTQGVTVMIMRDVEAALMRWSQYILNKYNPTVIAVAGSHGKSTACAAIAQVLGTKYQVYYHPSDDSGRYAVPLALSHLTEEHQLVILKLDITYMGEMADIMQFIPVTVAVITTIEEDDERLPNEIPALIRHLPPDGLAVLNYDSSLIRPLAHQAKSPTLTMSVDKDGTAFGADLIAYNLVVGVDKTGFDVRYGSDRYVGKWVSLLGSHQLYAILAAASVGLSFQIPMEEGLEALTHLEPLAGRMRPLVGLNGSLIIDDSHSASPTSVMAALDWLDAVIPQAAIRETVAGHLSPRGTVYVAISDLDNFDTRSPMLNRLADRIAGLASVVVCEGDQASLLASAVAKHGIPFPRLHMTFSPQDTAATLKESLTPKDLILVVGNAQTRMEQVVAAILAEPEQVNLLARADQLTAAELGNHPPYHSWVEVDLEAIAHNARRIRSIIGADCHFMAVVKADAYGHGAIPVSTTVLLNGADYLGVATVEEAVKLRQGGITHPILVLNYVPPYLANEVLKYDLSITIYDATIARNFNRAANTAGKKIRIHIRLDLGSGGIGVASEEMAVFFRALIRMESLELEGLYAILDTHEPHRVSDQLAALQEHAQLVRIGEGSYQFLHAASSAAALHIPESRLGMVRIGKALYGLQPHDNYPLPKDFKTALRWKTTIAQVKRLPNRMGMDKNGLPYAIKARTVAILPVGYSDGLHYSQGENSWTSVLIKGKRAPVVDQVGMYQTLVDISEIDDVRLGDEVVLIGQQGEEQITIEDVGQMLGMYTDEVVTLLMARQPRIK